MSAHRKLTQAEFYGLLTERFGEDVTNWAFKCPACEDVATVADFRVALEANPRTRDGKAVTASDIIGQECIGRTLGALERDSINERGCDWVAFGLIRGPWEIVLPNGNSMWCFPIADATAVTS